jgi:anti-sigma B factor antagonist
LYGGPQPFRIDVSRSNSNAPTIAVTGELDLAHSPELARVLRAELSQCERVQLDLSKVEFIDSTGLAAILSATRERPERRVLLTGELPAQARRLFELTETLSLLFDGDSPAT